MARPKTKSSLVDGVTELVDMIRNIDSKLNAIIKTQEKISPKRGRGRPPGAKGKTSGFSASSIKRGAGRPRKNAPLSKSKRGPGRPPKNAKKVSGKKSKQRGRGRPPGSKNK